MSDVNTKKENISILALSLSSGGAEKVISLLLKELKKDYNVNLVLFYNVLHFPVPKEVNIIHLSYKGIDRNYFLRFFDFFIFLFKYSKIIKKKHISTSISFLAFPNLMNGMLTIFNKKVKTIISERGFPSDNTTNKLSLFISKLFYPIFYNKCDALFSNSIHINKDLKENFGIKIPMEVIYNPIEVPSKTITPESLNNSQKSLKIITAGSLIIRKNHMMIIKALKEANDTSTLTILGGGPLMDDLKNAIHNFNMENKVTLKGKVKNVSEQLIDSNCFVLSSFTEGFPNALLEAMAVGLPCISTNCLSGPLELLNENIEIDIKNGAFYIAKYGILVNNDDHIGLQKALEYYRDNPEIREKFGRLSLERAKDYQIKKIYSIFNQFIKN